MGETRLLIIMGAAAVLLSSHVPSARAAGHPDPHRPGITAARADSRMAAELMQPAAESRPTDASLTSGRPERRPSEDLARVSDQKNENAENKSSVSEAERKEREKKAEDEVKKKKEKTKKKRVSPH